MGIADMQTCTLALAEERCMLADGTDVAVVLGHSPAKAGEAAGEATDHRGWDEYGNDWRNYYECMLAPVAQQAACARPHCPARQWHSMFLSAL